MTRRVLARAARRAAREGEGEGQRRVRGECGPVAGTQSVRFTSTKVQILTQDSPPDYACAPRNASGVQLRCLRDAFAITPPGEQSLNRALIEP
jgi:hypothetical protein